MHALAIACYIVIAAFFFAKLEIAIEGPDGWAAKLPTWRLPPEHWASKIFFGGKPATGYHLWANLFILFLAHIPYLFIPFALETELTLVATIILIFTLEDFFWFALNPAFGLANFKKEKVWWYAKTWWGFMPSVYVTGPLTAFVFYYLASLV